MNQSVGFVCCCLLLMASSLPGARRMDRPKLRQRDFWTEEQARQQLAAYAQTWKDQASWEKRAAAIREGILRGAELTPLPPKTDLKPIMRVKRLHTGYSVENVAFESRPGFFVTGNLYRPLETDPRRRHPVVLCAHGHCVNTRIPFAVNKTGGRFDPSTQILAGVLARMGAVVLTWDMTGINESQQYPHNGPKSLKIQLWNSIRAVDFVTSLPDVDPERIGMTGASGGATQTFLLAAVDKRIKVSIPVVMVSAHFFGGCNCESGMPIHVSDIHDTCNVEIAALHAPLPQLIISDGKDWTQNMPQVEFPYIRSIYQVYGAQDQVENLHLPDEGHDYGPSKRAGAYAFLARHLGLSLDPVTGPDGRVNEGFVDIDTYEHLCVFDDQHPRPAYALTDPNRIADF